MNKKALLVLISLIVTISCLGCSQSEKETLSDTSTSNSTTITSIATEAAVASEIKQKPIDDGTISLDNLGDPEAITTRADFITLLVKQTGIAVNNGELKASTKWYTEYKDYAKGWLPMDYSNQEMEAAIPRQEMAYILSKALNLPNKDDYQMMDLSKSPYEQQIKNCLAEGYLTGDKGLFSPAGITTKAQCAIIIDRMSQTREERLEGRLSPYGQLTRTTNMPKTYKEYSYILAEYPNEMYDDRPYTTCIFNWEQDENGNPCAVVARDYTWVEKYHPDSFTTNISNTKGFYADLFKDPAKVKMVTQRMYDSLYLRLNVDYRTIDYTWADKVYLTSNPAGDEVPEYRAELKRYVDYVKEHKIIVKSNKILVDSSNAFTQWYIGNNAEIWYKTYVDFDIVQFENLSKSDEFNVMYGCEDDSFVGYMKKVNYSGYMERSLNLLDQLFGKSRNFGTKDDLGYSKNLKLFNLSFKIQ